MGVLVVPESVRYAEPMFAEQADELVDLSAEHCGFGTAVLHLGFQVEDRIPQRVHTVGFGVLHISESGDHREGYPPTRCDQTCPLVRVHDPVCPLLA